MSRSRKTLPAKLGILSHVLPPAPTGQAVVLYKLLKDLPKDDYCLITFEGDAPPVTDNATVRLEAHSHTLGPGARVTRKGKGARKADLSTLVSLVLTFLRRTFNLYRLIQRERIEILVPCTANLLDIPVGLAAGRLAGVPVVPYLFDDYIHQWRGKGRSLARLLESRLAPHAKHFIFANDYLADDYRKRYPAIPGTVIYNASEICELSDLETERALFPADEVSIVYTGAIYRAHYDAFRNLIRALGEIPNSDVKLHIFTAEPPNSLLENRITGDSVIHHAHVPQADVSQILRQADILFLPLSFDLPIREVIRTSLPGKTAEYLSVARPILVHAPPGSFISGYFSRNECGLVVDVPDPAALKEAIEALLGDADLQARLSARARKAALRDFDLRVLGEKFVSVFEEFPHEGTPRKCVGSSVAQAATDASAGPRLR